MKSKVALLVELGPLVPTVFHDPWWLEVTSAGRYQEVEVRSDGRVTARLPFIIQRGVAGQRLYHSPELTHFLGPAIDTGRGNQANRALKHYRLTQELLSQLGPFSGFHQVMHRETPDTLAFEAAGFSTPVSFTYEIQPDSQAALWSGIRDKTRNVIRRAMEKCAISEWGDPSAFADFYEANLEARV